MNSNFIKLLFALCVFFLVILLIEFNFIGLSSEQLEGNPQRKTENSKPTELPQIKLSKPPEDNYADMTERPLFVKGRKPMTGMADDSPVEVYGAIEDLILVGVFSKDEGLVALINQKKSDKEFVKAAEGQDVSGYFLKEIHADHIILERDGRKQRLPLRKARPESKKLPKPRVQKSKAIPLKPKTIKTKP